MTFLLFVSKPVMGQNIMEAEKIYREEAAYCMQQGSRRIKEGTRQDLAPKDNAPSLHPARDYLIQCLDFPK